MNPLYVFLVQVGFTMILMALAARWWVMPRLRQMPVNRALAIVLFGGAIRYMGTLMLVPALAPSVEPDLVGAYTDIALATVALVGIIANRAGSPAGKPLAWLYALAGGADMLMVFVKGLRSGLWGNLTGGWTFVVAVFPIVGVTLVMTFLLLLRPRAHFGVVLNG